MLAGLAILVLGIDLFLPEDRKDVIGWISIASLVLVGALSLMMLPGHEESLYGGLVAVDAFSLLFKILNTERPIRPNPLIATLILTLQLMYMLQLILIFD